jgi:hypothetical protein
MALAKPERWSVTTRDAEDATPIELPRRGGVLVAALIVTAMFAVFAGVLAIQIHNLHFDGRDVSGLATSLFMLFWILGWSVGVLVLGALTVLLWLLIFYREAVYLRRGRLVSATRVGPLRMLTEYDLAQIRNLRIEQKEKGARVSFDYAAGSRSLGDAMPAELAEKIVATLRAAMPGGASPMAAPAPSPAEVVEPPRTSEPVTPGTAVVLVAANLVPVLGVLLWGWRLADVMVLYWAESAIVAFYTLLKMGVVGRWLAIPGGVFFLGHFGAFMAIHFLFLYEIFVRGLHAGGREPPLRDALTEVFLPLWPALLALFVSHGVSFAANFLGRHEYRSASLKALMAAPYNRVVLMQVTLIFGGGLALVLNDTRPALVLLVALKVAADLYAHRRERAPALNAPRRTGAAGTARSAER